MRYGAVEAAAATQEGVDYGDNAPTSDAIREKNVKRFAEEAAVESLILYSIDKDNTTAKVVTVIDEKDSIQVELKAGLIKDNLPPLIDGFLPDDISSKMIMRIEK